MNLEGEMAVYQEKAKTRIKNGISGMNRIIEKGKADGYNEADTRKIVSTVLTKYLGWDEFDNITAEQIIGSRYADYVIRKDGDQLAVIEVKQIGLKLKETHLNQARQYATDEGIEWIVLTNGDEWKVYRNVLEDNIPRAKHVFSLTISNKGEKPAEKTRKLYLMSEEASRKHEIEDYYDKTFALSGENLANYLLSDEVINKVRITLKNGTGQKFTNHDVALAMVENLFKDELVEQNNREKIDKKLAKIKKMDK